MERISGYQKRGFWALVLGVVMGMSVLFHLETSRAKPSVEYIGSAETKSEPAFRAPSSFPASRNK